LEQSKTELLNQGRIISIDKVKNELFDKNDALKHGAEDNLPEDFFKDTVSCDGCIRSSFSLGYF
jgi:hypothetical protein